MNWRPPKSPPESRGARTIRESVLGYSDSPPQSSSLTDYDRRNLAIYVRLLDAAEEGADWTEAARILFGLDPKRDGARARSVHDTHLARARWMAEHGYRDLLSRSRYHA